MSLLLRMARAHYEAQAGFPSRPLGARWALWDELPESSIEGKVAQMRAALGVLRNAEVRQDDGSTLLRAVLDRLLEDA